MGEKGITSTTPAEPLRSCESGGKGVNHECAIVGVCLVTEYDSPECAERGEV